MSRTIASRLVVIAMLIAAAGVLGCASPLVRPALRGDVATARRLLDAGADPNATDRKRRSALELAVLKQRPEMVRLLLERGANPNIVGPYRNTPLQHAAERGTGEIAELLIKAGADVNVRGRYGATPLIDAVYGRYSVRHTDVVEALIRGGADLNATEPRRAGGTALHAAIQRKNVPIAKLLIEAGADVSIRDRRGATPAELAIRLREQQIAQLLRGPARPTPGYSPQGPRIAGQAEREPPRIFGPGSVRTENPSVSFELRVSDDSAISEARIEGRLVSMAQDGSVEVRRAVPEGESSLLFEVVDEWGNKASKAIQVTRTMSARVGPSHAGAPATGYPDLDFGDYYALVIGNDRYQSLPPLRTAVNDARGVAQLLKRRYGYEVTKLENATRADILTSLASYRRKLTERDNLLIYYAGHGWLDAEADRGYWLPVDATLDDEINWVSNSAITGSVRAMKAKHVLLVADSCYSGKLARGVHIRRSDPDYLRRISEKRARVVLTSGGLEPVSDSGGGGHSVFAAAFLEALDQNQGLLEGHELFTLIRRPVAVNSDQIPEYSDLRKAGHEGGDFLFVQPTR